MEGGESPNLEGITMDDPFEFEHKMGEILNEMHNRGVITYDERESIRQLFLEYGWNRYKEGFDEGLSK